MASTLRQSGRLYTLAIAIFPVLQAYALPQAGTLPTWNGSFSYQGTQYSYTMVGTSPTGGGSTAVPVYLIPVKITIGSAVYDPSAVLDSVLASPIFCTASGSNQCAIDFMSGGHDFGVTQYLDAYQRANFWIDDSNNNYHLTLGGSGNQGPSIINESINPPTNNVGVFSSLCNVGGSCEGWVDDTWWRNYINQTLGTLLQANQITTGGLTVFLTYNVCDGIYDITSHEWRCGFYGFHSDTVFGSTPQVVTWLFAEYSDISAIPYTDVDVLSHEVGEWADDPYYSNSTYCGEMEVGDPLEGPPPQDHNYGAYHLQDLVFLRWFGADIDTSVNNQWSFQNETLSVCTPP